MKNAFAALLLLPIQKCEFSSFYVYHCCPYAFIIFSVAPHGSFLIFLCSFPLKRLSLTSTLHSTWLLSWSQQMQGSPVYSLGLRNLLLGSEISCVQSRVLTNTTAGVVHFLSAWLATGVNSLLCKNAWGRLKDTQDTATSLVLAAHRTLHTNLKLT